MALQKNQRAPLVSVIMPVYNGQLFVSEAIESILNQTYQNFELLIIDDASSDNTWKILSTFRKKFPKKISIFRLKKNGGPAVATNFGFKKSRGKFLAIMDSDDISHPKRLAKQVAFLQKKPQAIVLGTQAKVIDRNGKIIGQKTFPLNHSEIYDLYGRIHPMVHPSIMIRKELLPSKKQLYKNRYGINADYYNLFNFLNYGEFANLSQSLLFYRVHGNNGSLKHLKKCYWDILFIRMEANVRLKYTLSLKNCVAMFLQTIIVTMLPEKTLQYLYFSVKGYHMTNPSQSKLTFNFVNSSLLLKNILISPLQHRISNLPTLFSNWSHSVIFSAFQNE